MAENIPSRTLAEVFEVGFAFARFIPGCQDERDLARFFETEGLPDWAKAYESEYVKRSNSLTPLDEGIVITKQILTNY